MSILDRYNERQARLESATADLDAAAGVLDVLPGVVPPGPVHIAAANVLANLVSMGNDLADDETPLQLRVLMRGIESFRPMLLEMFAKVPPEQVVEFMTRLRDDIQGIIDVGPEQLEAADDDHGAE